MKIRNVLLAAGSAVCLCACTPESSDREMDRFIDDLMSRMTLEEKLGQMNLPAVPRSKVITGN